jgi:hypothetical protein
MNRILIAGFLCLACSSAHAFTITYSDPGSNTNAIGITGLDIAGELWDITWDDTGDGVGDATDGNPADCRDIYAYYLTACPGTPSGSSGLTPAIAAGNAIAAALAGSTATTVGSTSENTFDIPYLYDNSSCNQPGNGTCTVWVDGFNGWQQNAIDSEISLTSTRELAKFTAHVAVPVPPAVWLFGSALGLLGWIRHRSRQRST